MLLSGVQKYLKAYGCLIKALRHDERGRFPTKTFENDRGDGRLTIFQKKLLSL